jgi:hypothetical protein
LELELETAVLHVQLRRPFDAMHFLLTPFPTLGVPQAGRLLPPMPAKTTEAPKSSAVA